MTMQALDPGSGNHNPKQQLAVVQRRFLIASVLLILLPLAVVRFSLFFAAPRDRPPLSAEMLHDASIECDLVDGEWVRDKVGPSYSNATCQHIQGHQNCLKNGRPDTQYMYWRWQPHKCDLPRFNASVFMSIMRNKLLAFVGDSIARNHMQSLLCSLSQLEIPIKTYTDEDDRHVRWWFPSNNVTVSTFWSPYLIFQTDEPTGTIPEGHSQLHLDKLDPVWLSNITEFDAVILSAGQWFFKTNLFFLNNTLVGCHHCNTTIFNTTGLGFYYAYHNVLAGVLQALSSHPDYRGITILRSFSPDHFEDGRWDNGGSCKRTVPFSANTTVPENTLTFEMHKLQVEAYGDVAPSRRLRMLDITRLSYLRPDGHPGPYRNFQPFSKEFKGYVQNDCLHWCIPGPVDAWNDLVLETLRRVN